MSMLIPKFKGIWGTKYKKATSPHHFLLYSRKVFVCAIFLIGILVQISIAFSQQVIFSDQFAGTSLDLSKWTVFDDRYNPTEPGSSLVVNYGLTITIPANSNNNGWLGVVSTQDFSNLVNNVSYEVEFMVDAMANWQDCPLLLQTPLGLWAYNNSGNGIVGYQDSAGQYAWRQYAWHAGVPPLSQLIPYNLYKFKIETKDGYLRFLFDQSDGRGYVLSFETSDYSTPFAYHLSGRYIGKIVLGNSDQGASIYKNLIVANLNNPKADVSISSSVNPSTYGQSVTFTATVSSDNGVPTGEVTFKDGDMTIGTGTLDGSGQAIFTTSALDIGLHSITAEYGGDANFAGSVSPPLNQTVMGIKVKLIDHNGVGIPGATVKWADGSWHPVGFTGPDGTLTFVPGDWNKIAMTYHQGTVYKYPGETLVWQTVQTTIRLVDHTGLQGLPGASIAQGGGYWDVGPGLTDSDGNVYWEVFPDTDYKFRVTYNAASVNNWFHIDPTGGVAQFQTGAVTSQSGRCTQYAQGSWQSFYQGIELLPGSAWHFRFNDGFPITYYNIVSGTENIIH